MLNLLVIRSELYGVSYTDDMPYVQKEAIKTAIPMVLSEAEPRSFDEN